MIGRYFNACNEIENQKRIWNSYLELEKLWVTKSGYFRLVTDVELGMRITYAKLLLCLGISE